MDEIFSWDSVRVDREMYLKMLKKFELSKYKVITKRNLEKHAQ